jgi:glycosidase
MRALVLALVLVSCSQVIPPPVVTPVPSAAAVPATTDQSWYELNFQTLSPPTLGAATARLDSLQSLGINVLWLMPIYPKGVLHGVGSPYSVQSYTDVNPDLGTLEDLKTLVRGAHARGISVVLDWVPNHTSWDHPWIAQHPDWYLQDGSGHIISPPNTGWNDVAALNYSNMAMRQAMTAAMTYWITAAGVDGFRCDFADNQPSSFWTAALAAVNTAAGQPRILLAEGSQTWQFTSGFALNYAWDYNSALQSVWNGAAASTLFTTNTAEYAGIPSGGQKLRYTSNHDLASSSSTVTVFQGTEGETAAFAAAALLGGVPLVSSGQEVGWPSALSFFGPAPVDWNAHPEVRADYAWLLSLRQNHSALRTGTLTPYADTNVLAFERVAGEHVLVLINTRNSSQTFNVPVAVQGTWTDLKDNTTTVLGSSLAMSAYQVTVLSR